MSRGEQNNEIFAQKIKKSSKRTLYFTIFKTNLKLNFALTNLIKSVSEN